MKLERKMGLSSQIFCSVYRSPTSKPCLQRHAPGSSPSPALLSSPTHPPVAPGPRHAQGAQGAVAEGLTPCGGNINILEND